MGDHLKVDVALIRATAGGLGLVKDALQRADASNPGAGVLGLGGLAEAISGFCGPSSQVFWHRKGVRGWRSCCRITWLPR